MFICSENFFRVLDNLFGKYFTHDIRKYSCVRNDLQSLASTVKDIHFLSITLIAFAWYISDALFHILSS